MSRKANRDLIYELFCGMLPQGGRILDAGCGTGIDSVAFKKRGFKAIGFDACAAMVELAKAKGVRAYVQTFQELDEVNSFDGVWACASLLHVPRMQIRRVLKRLVRALRPMGVLYITLKEGFGEGFGPDARFSSYYQLREFRMLLECDSRIKNIMCWRTKAARLSGNTARLHFFAHRSPATAIGRLSGNAARSLEKIAALDRNCDALIEQRASG
jgi:ubiquinone/menaquinone biosynthesis C-methylase UbiE